MQKRRYKLSGFSRKCQIVIFCLNFQGTGKKKETVLPLYYLPNMSGMELTANYTPSKFAADNDLVKVDVVNKYRSAGDIVNGKSTL